MRILIVGSQGMLGADLMSAFSGSDTLWGFDVSDVDITDFGQCQERLLPLRPDVIVNAAALTAVDYCESHEEEAFRVNCWGAGNLATVASTMQALLVHFSTDYVFDGFKQGPYIEEDPPGPRSVYGKSKLRGEELIREMGSEHLIVRTAWLFGRNGKNFIRTILAAARSGKVLRVVDDQRGSPTYTLDLADCTVRLIRAGCRGLYHVTNGGACTWHELAVRAVECASIPGVRILPVSTQEYPLPAPRPANSVLANARLARDGLPLLRPWQEAVQEYIRRM
jgi:dTDP-4-dehydrorhamnose reductase